MESMRTVVDCSAQDTDSAVVQVPMTDEELAHREGRIAAQAQVRAAREADLELMRAKAADDPAFAALARAQGIDL